MTSNTHGPLANRLPAVFPADGFELEHDNVWCPSPIQDAAGGYHLLFSRWPVSRGHEAWVIDSRVSHAVADSPLGPWKLIGDILPPRENPELWDADVTHNPQVLEDNGRYYLYYTGTRGNGFWNNPELRPAMQHPEWWVNRNQQRIGVAWADRLDGPWQRSEQPLMSPPPGYRTCGTPFVLKRHDGRWQMVFKAVTEDGTRVGGAVRHFVAVADNPLGPFAILPNPIFAGVKSAFPVDDHCQWLEDGSYWCIAKDNGENIAGYSPCLILFHSPDGFTWRPFQPHFTIPFAIPLADGSSRLHERLEMPKFLFANGKPQFLFLAALPAGTDKSHCIIVPLHAAPPGDCCNPGGTESISTQLILE